MFYKRVFRELKANKGRYFLIFLILAVVLTMVVENIMAAGSVNDKLDDYFKSCNAEDGEFITFMPLEEELLSELEDKGVNIEEQFYCDIKQADDSVIRVFKNREEINLADISEGCEAQAENEVVIENSYAQAHDIKVGDTIDIAGQELTVTGIATVPDYTAIRRNISDLSTDNELFGLAFTTVDTYNNLYISGKAESDQTISYAYRLSEGYTSKELKQYLKDIPVPDIYKIFGIKSCFISLVETDSNPRMTGYRADIKTTMSVSIMMGILMAALVAFVIAIFECHTIDRESVIIGTLYSMGVMKKDLLKQYVLLPVIVIILGGMGGILLGYSICPAAISVMGASYSFPEIVPHFYPIALVYGVVLPALLGFIVNIIVINRKLKKEPLDLLRRTRSSLKVSKKRLDFAKFRNVYRVRQLLREKAIYIILFIGVFYSVGIMLFSFTISSALNNYVSTCTDDVKWEYMYTMKRIPEEVPDGAQKYVSQRLSANNVYSGEDVNLTLIGVPEDSSFFNIREGCSDGEIIISDCAAKKFSWSEGDTVTFKNPEDDSEHKLTIKSIVDYSAGLFVFMPDEQVYNEFNIEEGYCNILFSSKELDELDTKLIWSVTSKEDISKASEVLKDSMKATIGVMLGASIIVFIAVMYLLLKQTLDKASFGISLIKIFGYTEGEVRSIFIDANFILVIIASLLAFVLGKPVIDNMYPNLVTDIDVGFDTSFAPATYVIAAGIIIVTYLISMLMLGMKLKKMDYTEVLKNRE